MLSFLCVVLAALIAVTLAAGPTTAPPRLSGLAMRLQDDPTVISRDDGGKPSSVFGLSAAEARILLLPVSRERPLPFGYQPLDLVWVLKRPIRSIIADDLLAMIESAAADSVELAVASGFRSPNEQTAAFEIAVERALARNPGWSRSDAEGWATHFVAPPGYSQHQLGTAVDLANYETNYALTPWFTETALARWLVEHAWAYGFVIPYTREGESRTGYGFEPWHVRWVGRPLAARMHADRYLDNPEVVADDYLLAVEELMDMEGVP